MSSFDNNPGWKYDFKFNDPNTWLPTFGKWCGKGWSGGQRTGNTELSDVQKSESVTQINNRDSTVDIWCRTHDFAINATYGSPRRQLETLTADLARPTGWQQHIHGPLGPLFCWPTLMPRLLPNKYGDPSR